MSKLPLANYMTLKYLVWFFKECLFPFEAYNKMSPDNLARILAPSFIRSFKPSVADLMNMPKLVSFVKNIIVNSDRLFKLVDKIKNL